MPKCDQAKTAGWCGLCYEGLRGKSNHVGHAGYRSQPRRLYWGEAVWVGDPMKRPERVKGGATRATVGRCPDIELLAKCPNVVEHLVASTYDDGSKRERSTLTVFIEDGHVKIALNDRQEKQSFYVTAERLWDALEGMESHLVDGKAEWRYWKR